MGKEKKYMDKGANAKELTNFGISLICDRRLSGAYMFFYNSHSRKSGRNEASERKRRARRRQMRRGAGEERKEEKVMG